MWELLLPAQRRLQAVHRLAGGLQDALPAPHPHLPGSRLGANGADGKQLAVAPPGHPRPAVVPGCGRLHLLQVKAAKTVALVSKPQLVKSCISGSCWN